MKNRMNDLSRNDLCPCGSGKKYKKCCLPKDEAAAEELLNESQMDTGTPLDEYVYLFRGIVIYGQGQMGNGPYARVLHKEYESFTKQFKPGLEEAISDGLFLTWFYLDLRYGMDQRTIAERFIEEGLMKRLNDPGPEFIRRLAESYCAFYEIKKMEEDWLVLEELGTGRIWKVSRAGESPEQGTAEGQLWYVRLVGTPREAYFFIAPYVYGNEHSAGILGVVEEQKRLFGEYLGKPPSDFTPKDFADSCKAAVRSWAGILTGETTAPEKKNPIAIQNTDGEKLRFSKIFFRIIHRERLEEKLSSMPGLEFDSQSQIWLWSKKGNRKIEMFPSTSLGTLRIEGEYLTAETNSLERALRLKNKLLKSCAKFLAYEKIEARDLQSMPPLTKAEHEKFEREQQELAKNPEVRKLMKRKAEDYYYKEWIQMKIPALGNKTPLQAAKSVLGRVQLQALLVEFEARQKMQDPDDPFRFDLNELRRILGLVQ